MLKSATNRWLPPQGSRDMGNFPTKQLGVNFWHVLHSNMTLLSTVVNLQDPRSLLPHEEEPNVSNPFDIVLASKPYINQNPIFLASARNGTIGLFQSVLCGPFWTRVQEQDAWITRARREIYLPPKIWETFPPSNLGSVFGMFYTQIWPCWSQWSIFRIPDLCYPMRRSQMLVTHFDSYRNGIKHI